MSISRTQVLALSLCAGCASGLAGAANTTPTKLSPTLGQVQKTAHIYFNLATGERVVTVIGDGQTSAADTGESELLWGMEGGSQCTDAGLTSAFFFAVDDFGGTTALATQASLLDYGDIAADTVVDCVHIDWVVQHADIDADSDGLGDGVEGLGAEWTYWDGENGRPLDVSTRTGLIGFTFTDLPGNIAPEGFLSGYTADIDLAATFTGTSLVFEICDTDSDLQGAAVHNANFGNGDLNFDNEPDSDLDGNNLADWGWRVRFFQPGTVDFDSDGTPDGSLPDPDASAIGVSFAFPTGGTAIDNGDGTWSVEIDDSVPGAATGSEDGFGLFFPPDADDEFVFAGNFFFGGFACELDPDTNQYTPYAGFEHQLLGPGGTTVDPCPADLNDDDNLNFFDVSLFLADFNMGGDYNDDGSTNFFDVSKFLSDFNAGCP